MNELYWITRLDAICVLGTTMMIVGIIAGVIVTILSLIVAYDEDATSNDKRLTLILRKTSYSILGVGLLLTIFVPNTKEAIMIYGIGGTIDYLKSNDTVKQLPDKCVMALDKWVDSYVEPDSIK